MNKRFPEPGDRLLRMAEGQMAHRQEWEKSALQSAQRVSARGQWFGFVIALAAMSAGTYIAVTAQELLIMPIMLGGAGVIGLVASFINAVRRRQSNGDE